MLKVSTLILFLIANSMYFSTAFQMSIYYCAFSPDYCGDTNLNIDDVSSKTNFVILAFAITTSKGSINVDDQNYPATLVAKWKSINKKIILSIGGEFGNWKNVLASTSTITNFVSSISKALTKYQLDGVDLDIERYDSSPSQVINMIKQLRAAIGPNKLIIVSPQCVTVYQGSKVPDKLSKGIYWNYFVPIIQEVDNLINYYQPQAYNNWYYFPPGSLNYLKQVYLNWRNLPSLTNGLSPIINFKGVSASKLLMGILGSATAGDPGYYYNPTVLKNFKAFLTQNKYELFGFMIWDSHQDQLNKFTISNAINA